MSQNLIVLWEQYSDLLWEEGKHKEACRAYVDEIHRFMLSSGHHVFDNHLLDRLTVHFRQNGNRNSTINRKFASLSKILRKHYRNGGLPALPDFKKLPERNARIRFLTHEEEELLLRKLEVEDERYAQLSRFLVESGARIGEALTLNWSDIEAGYATFWETKSYRPRTIPLTQRASSTLKNVRKSGGHKSGPFHSVAYFRFRRAWNAAKERTEMRDDPQVVPHVLRHVGRQFILTVRRQLPLRGGNSLSSSIFRQQLAEKDDELSRKRGTDSDGCIVETGAFPERSGAASRGYGGHGSISSQAPIGGRVGW